MIVYFTSKKYDLKVIPTEANEVSEVPVRRPEGPGLRSK